jgi:hypothetical protein
VADDLESLMGQIRNPSTDIASVSNPTIAPNLSSDQQALIEQLQNANAAKRVGIEAEKTRLQRLDQALAFGSSLADALTFGFGHEAAAALEAPFSSKTYGDIIREYGGLQQQLQTEYPKTALAGAITGGAVPVLLSGGAAATPGTLRTLLLGQTAEGAIPTVYNLAKIGAAQGALQGAGAAEPTPGMTNQEALVNRIVGGSLGAALGGVGTPILAKTIGGTIAFGGEKLAELGLTKQSLRDALQSLGTINAERGAVTLSGQTPEALRAADIVIAKKLAEGTLSDVDAALLRAQAAEAANVPMFLPEAVQSPAMYQSAKLTTVQPGGISYAQKAIEQRAAEAGTRIENALNRIAQPRTTTAGAQELVTAANTIQEALVQKRGVVASQLYKVARDEAPEIISQDLTELISKDKALRGAIKTVKSYAGNADLSNTSLEVLDQARRILADKIEGAGRNEARLLQGTKDKLTKIMEDAAPTYKAARAAYEEASRPLNDLEKSKFILIRDFDPEKPESLGQIFNQSPEVIASLRNNFAEAGQEAAWRSGVRAYLQHLVNKAPETAQGRIARLVESRLGRERLQAALGDANSVVDTLQSELEILKGQQKYYVGSPTAPMQFEAEDTAKTVNAVKNVLSGRLKDALLGIFQPDQTALYRDLAESYFTPGSVIPQLERLKPLVETYQTLRGANIATQRGLGSVTGEVTGQAESARQSLLKKESKGIGGAALALTPAAINQKDLDSLMTIIRGQQSATPTATNNKSDVTALLNSKPPIIKAIAWKESRFNPNAEGPKTRFGTAKGMMQIIDSTAKSLGITDPFDPVQSLEGGERYYNQLLNQFGSPQLALAAYNWGPSNVLKAQSKVKKQGLQPTWSNIIGNTYVPKQTREYVKDISNKVKEFEV